MKHIKEYSDDELLDLMGNLENVGQGQLKGWVIEIVNNRGLRTSEILIANDWTEALRIYDKHGIVTGQGNHLASVLSRMKSNGGIIFWDILDGYKSKGYKKGYKKWQNNNPYITIEILDNFFTNSRSITDNNNLNSSEYPKGIDTLLEF